jgi:hypothetical protein
MTRATAFGKLASRIELAHDTLTSKARAIYLRCVNGEWLLETTKYTGGHLVGHFNRHVDPLDFSDAVYATLSQARPA